MLFVQLWHAAWISWVNHTNVGPTQPKPNAYHIYLCIWAHILSNRSMTGPYKNGQKCRQNGLAAAQLDNKRLHKYWHLGRWANMAVRRRIRQAIILEYNFGFGTQNEIGFKNYFGNERIFLCCKTFSDIPAFADDQLRQNHRANVFETKHKTTCVFFGGSKDSLNAIIFTAAVKAGHMHVCKLKWGAATKEIR